MNKKIQKYISENISIIIKLVSIYAIGIVIGVIFFKISGMKQDYIKVVQDIFNSTKEENFKGINLIYNGIKNNVVIFATLYLSLLTIIAPFIIGIIIMLKGAMLGIYTCIIFNVFGFGKGLIVTILTILLPNLLSLLAYIFSSTNIISFFKKLAGGETIGVGLIIKQVYWCVLSLSLLCLSVVVEQLISGIILRLYNKV